jgi:hypothetical protein
MKVARQELPGKAEKQKTVPVGTADRSHFQPSLPGLYRSRVFLPGSACRAIFNRAWRRFPPRQVKICAHLLFREMPSAFLFKDIYGMGSSGPLKIR